MRCLLVEHPDGLVLIDSGLGNKEDAKFIDIYGIENAGRPGPTLLEDAPPRAGARARRTSAGSSTPTCISTTPAATRRGPPAAARGAADLSRTPRYVVQRGELEFARHTNERTRASYLPHNFEPVAAAGQFDAARRRRRGAPGHPRPARRRATCRTTSRCWSSDGGDTLVFLGRPDPDLRATCRCPGSWATTSSRCGRSSPAGRCSGTPWRGGGCCCSSTTPGWRTGGRSRQGRRRAGRRGRWRPALAPA